MHKHGILIPVPVLKEQLVQLVRFLRVHPAQQEPRDRLPVFMGRRIQPVIRPRLDGELAVGGREDGLDALAFHREPAFEHGDEFLLVRVEVQRGFFLAELDELRVVEAEGDGEGEAAVREGHGQGRYRAVEAVGIT